MRHVDLEEVEARGSSRAGPRHVLRAHPVHVRAVHLARDVWLSGK